MKISYILLSIIMPFISIDDHDVPIAIFRLNDYQATINLEVTLDIQDYCKTYQITPDKITKTHLTENINKASTWTIDQQKSNLYLYDYLMEEDHLKAYFIIEDICSANQEIYIENTFLHGIYNHSNIIQIDFQGKERDFRMHRGRTKINIALDK